MWAFSHIYLKVAAAIGQIAFQNWQAKPILRRPWMKHKIIFCFNPEQITGIFIVIKEPMRDSKMLM